LGAVGRLTRAITLTRRRKVDIAEKTPDLVDAKSYQQLSWRTMFLMARDLWHDLSAVEKRAWEAAGTARHMTGYAWFISQALRPNPGIYLPLLGGTMQGDIDMASFRALALPAPTIDQEAATKKYVDEAEARATYTEGARVYHSESLTITNATWTSLTFNREIFDTDAIHDPVTNNSRLTCKTAGIYIIISQLVIYYNAVGVRANHIRLNLTTNLATSDVIPTSATLYTASVAACIYPLIVGDFVESLVYQNSGGGLTAIGLIEGFSLMMQRVG